jgi:hypothetical protein
MGRPSERKLPSFDQVKDGNPFEWIIRQMPALHQKQAIERRNRPRYDPLTGRLIPASAPADSP